MLSELRIVPGRSLLRQVFEDCYGGAIETSIDLAVTAGQDSDLLETLESLDDRGITTQAWILRNALAAFSELDAEISEEILLGEPDEAMGNYIDPFHNPMTRSEALADQDLAKARTEVALSAHRRRMLVLFDTYRCQWSSFYDLIHAHRSYCDVWNACSREASEIDRILTSTRAACRALATLSDGHGRSLLARTAGRRLADDSRRTVGLLNGWYTATVPFER